jgi:hypothetical protein
MTISEYKVLREIDSKISTDDTLESPYTYKSLIPTEIKTGLEEKLKPEVEIEKQIIVHCHYYNHGIADQIRIWETTYLIAKHNEYRSKLISSYNIAKYPQLLTTIPYVTHNFTLVFEALPKECKIFDLLEDIPETGGFYINNIRRNKSDIYDLKINYY